MNQAYVKETKPKGCKWQDSIDRKQISGHLDLEGKGVIADGFLFLECGKYSRIREL